MAQGAGEEAARSPETVLEDVVTVGDVLDAVDRDLQVLGGGLELSALAATARSLARELDKAGNSATSKSMVARSLLDTMDRLRELAPPRKEEDGVDELERKRERRRASAGVADPADQSRS